MSSFILMGDVIGSSRQNESDLANQLQGLVGSVNAARQDDIVSPLTVTLGDEFQAVCKSFEGASRTVQQCNEGLLRRSRPFELRYVIYQGKIETEINPDIAHGMLGEGLTKARELLSRKDSSRARTQIVLEDKESETFHTLLYAIIDNMWNEPGLRRFPEIFAELLYTDGSDEDVAEMFDRERSQVWKYRRNWNMVVYRSSLEMMRQGFFRQ